MMTRGDDGRWHPAACLYASMANHSPPWSPPSPVHLFHPHAQLRPPAVKPRPSPCSPKRRGAARGKRKHRRNGSQAMGARAEPSGRFRLTQKSANRCENPREPWKDDIGQQDKATRESREPGPPPARPAVPNPAPVPNPTPDRPRRNRTKPIEAGRAAKPPLVLTAAAPLPHAATPHPLPHVRALELEPHLPNPTHIKY